MRRQLTCPPLDKVYRQFSRQHYKKYSSMFPKLRQAEIVTRIIKEWEGLKQSQKEALGAQYLTQSYIKTEEEKSSSNPIQPQATPLKKNHLHLFTTETKTKHSSLKKVSISGFGEEESEFNRHSERMSGDSRSELSSSPKSFVGPTFTKLGQTAAHRRYIHFYQFYYKKLKKEHPRWIPSKLSTIIKLLWKREQVQQKNQRTKTKRITKLTLREPKRCTGKTLFRKQKQKEGLTSDKINMLWKRFPKETKLMFDQREMPGLISPCKAKTTWKLNSEDMSEINEANRTLKFLHKKME